ncbi:hypothetical protein [Burkholderia sp. Ac-20353]|uniref:hypothetical protein n=1 Tax=Burkholderia sp. Ac-20353 TaxID=2703894 RepID=UPI00197B9804|nr:hypothetical protein [Burkholderia sp. Ac-20353]MBN3792047.1 hypothetical protein [Burkholderia sp. Ac-20353]
MKTLTYSGALCAFLVISACAQLPGSGATADASRYDPSYLKQNLIPGKTSRDQVLALFGDPSDKGTRSDGSESWSYVYDPNNRAKTIGITSLWNSIPMPGMLGVAANTVNGQVLNAANPAQPIRYLTVHLRNGVVTDYSVHASK